MEEKIPASFITYSSNILADTVEGLSGSKIVEHTSSFSFDYDVELPHPTYPFFAANKRTALRENLLALPPKAQFLAVKSICDDDQIRENGKVKDIKIKLISRYG